MKTEHHTEMTLSHALKHKIESMRDHWFNNKEDQCAGEDTLKLTDNVSLYFTYNNDDQEHECFTVTSALICDRDTLIEGRASIRIGRVWHQMETEIFKAAREGTDEVTSALELVRKHMINGYIQATEDMFKKLRLILKVSNTTLKELSENYLQAA